GDVEVDPGGAGDELAQEQCRLDAVAGLVGGVEQVGDLGVEEAAVVLDQGQLAGQLPGAAGGGQDLGGEGRGVAEHAGAAEAQAVTAARIAAAPAMSSFIPSMPAPRLRSSPPLSKVTPLPTRATCRRAVRGR